MYCVLPFPRSFYIVSIISNLWHTFRTIWFYSRFFSFYYIASCFYSFGSYFINFNNFNIVSALLKTTGTSGSLTPALCPNHNYAQTIHSWCFIAALFLFPFLKNRYCFTVSISQTYVCVYQLNNSVFFIPNCISDLLSNLIFILLELYHLEVSLMSILSN